MPDLTATVYPNEAYVLIQTDWLGTLLLDTFSRTLPTTWGSPDIGPAWVLDGAAAVASVNGSQGLITHNAVNTGRTILSAVNVADIDMTGTILNTAVPTGANFDIGFQCRYVDGNNRAEARFRFLAAGGANCDVRQIVAGVSTSSSAATVPGVANIDNVAWRLRAQGTLLAFRAWKAGTPEPATWLVTLTTTWLTAGSAGVISFVANTVTTPTPIVFAFDNFVFTNPNAVTTGCAIVTRRNTVTGEVVQLRPYISFDGDGAMLLECGQGLWWDTEPPLNVPLEYCTLPCDAETLRSLNPTFDQNEASWSGLNGVVTQDCTVAKVGTCSGRLTPGGTNTNPSIFQDGILLTGGLVSTMSTWAMSPQGWNSVYLSLVVTYSDLTTETIQTDMITLDDNEWRFLSITFTPRLDVISSRFSFVAAGLPPNTTLFNVDELKVTQFVASTATDCQTVTVSSESVWLKSPLHPCDDVEIGLCSPMLADCDEDNRVSYAGTFDDTYGANTVLVSPTNRQFPIAINRVRRAPTATLRLITHDCDATQAVLDANAPGDPLLFQAPATYCIPDRYISVGDLSETRVSVDQREDFRVMTLPYATVERPEGSADGPCGTRFEDLCDIYSSWAALAIAGFTWTDLMLGEASPNGPGQPPAPEGARTWDDVEAEFMDWDAVEAGGTRDWDELRDGL